MNGYLFSYIIQRFYSAPVALFVGMVITLGHRHRLVPYTSIRKSLSSAGKRAALGHVRPHDLRHTFVTRLQDLGVPIEQVNYLAGHKSMAMTKRYDHANEERYGGAIEALDKAGKTGKAEALAAARRKQTD